MELGDLIPKESTLKLENSGRKLEFALGKFSIEKAKQLNDRFDGKLEQVLQTGRSQDLALVAWSLMKIESKRALMEIKFVDMDDEGNEHEVCRSGPEKLMGLMSSIDDVLKVWECVGHAIGVSTDLTEVRKKPLVDKKKRSNNGSRANALG